MALILPMLGFSHLCSAIFKVNSIGCSTTKTIIRTVIWLLTRYIYYYIFRSKMGLINGFNMISCINGSKHWPHKNGWLPAIHKITKLMTLYPCNTTIMHATIFRFRTVILNSRIYSKSRFSYHFCRVGGTQSLLNRFITCTYILLPVHRKYLQTAGSTVQWLFLCNNLLTHFVRLPSSCAALGSITNKYRLVASSV